MRKITSVIVHHSASTFGDWEFICRLHKARGMITGAYHAVVLNGYRKVNSYSEEDLGVVERGRNETVVGAHTVGYNSHSLGICLIGNFDAHNGPVAQWGPAIGVVSAWCKRYGIPSHRVLGHREAPGQSTACPGRNLDMAAFRRDVALKLDKEHDEEDVRKVTLKRDDTGEQVKDLQRQLGIIADGIFGPKTEAAVKAYQARAGLMVDGIAGPATMAALNGVGDDGKPSQAGTVTYTSGAVLPVAVTPLEATTYKPAHPKKAGPLVALDENARQVSVSAHFRLGEFACHDSDFAFVRVNPELVVMLERIRSAVLGRPITVLSGYRPRPYNVAISGSADNSYHIDGAAADIKVDGISTDALAHIAEDCVGSSGGVGTYLSSGFVHVDVRGSLMRWNG